MRLKPRFILPLLIFALLISYQNFSVVPSSDWDSAGAIKIMNEMSEFEKNNSTKSVLATPQGGNDLKSVTSDWMERQGRIILNGYDKQVEQTMNDALNSWVQDLSSEDPINDRNHVDEVATSESVPVAETEETPKKTKHNLRFSRVNALKYDLGESTCVDLVADPGNTRLNYSQTLSSNTKFGFEHRTSDNKTQMLFNYEW